MPGILKIKKSPLVRRTALEGGVTKMYDLIFF
jgi:hypothetical protein